MSENAALERLEHLLLEQKISAEDFVEIAKGLRESRVSTVEARSTTSSALPDAEAGRKGTLIRSAVLNAGIQLGLLVCIPLILGLFFSNTSMRADLVVLSVVYCTVTVAAAQLFAVPVGLVFYALARSRFSVTHKNVYIAASWVSLILLLPSLIASD